jgi:zinc protease
MILDRSQAPEFRIPEHISFPSPEKRTLSNGVPLYFIPTQDIDAVRIELNTDVLHKGVNEKALVSYFTLHCLMSGTARKTAAELDEFFDFYASEVEVIAGLEFNSITLVTTRKYFKSVLPVFRELLTEAVFPEKELGKKKTQKALNISIQREQNGAQASLLFRQSLFGAEHPFGHISREDDVALISREDLCQYYEKALWTNPEMFITGNLDESDLNFIYSTFGNLPNLSTSPVLSFFETTKHNRTWEDRPKSLQSSIRLGCHLIPKNHPDYHALYVFNVFLGGYFGSRLIKNIREDKGHTYGIHSSIGGLRAADYWIVMADVVKAHTEEVITEVYKEIRKLQLTPADPEEVETVRNYMIGNLLSQFSSSFDLINKFKSIHHAGLDFSFYEQQLEFIRNFEINTVMEAGQRYLTPEEMVEVIVG